MSIKKQITVITDYINIGKDPFIKLSLELEKLKRIEPPSPEKT